MRPDITRLPFSGALVIFVPLLLFFWAGYWSWSGGTAMPVADIWTGFWSHAGEFGAATADAPTLPVAGAVAGFEARFPVASIFVSLIIVLLNSLMLTRVLARNMVFTARNYLSVVIYVCICCGIFIGPGHLAVFAASWMILRAVQCYTEGFVRGYGFGRVFAGSFLVGAAPLLWPPAVVVFPIVPVALLLFRRRGREALVTLVGLLLPWAACAYAMWAAGRPFTQLFTDTYAALATPSAFTPCPIFSEMAPVPVFSILVLTAAWTVAGAACYAGVMRKMRTRQMKVSRLMLLLLAFSASVFLLPCGSMYDLAIVAIPASVAVTQLFVRIRGVVSVVLFVTFVVGIVAYNVL